MEKFLFTWDAQNFSSFSKPNIYPPTPEGLIIRSGFWGCVNSPVFSIEVSECNRSMWRIKMCPYKVIDGEEYVGMYLQNILSSCVFRVQFEISLVSQEGHRIHWQFGDYKFGTGAIFGWENFIRRKELLNELKCLLVNDTLSIHCTMQTEVEKKTAKNRSVASSKNCLLKSLYDNNLCSDVVLKTADREFHAHKAVLAAASSVFEDKFKHGTEENSSDVLQLDDIEGHVLEQMLKYIYCSELDVATPENLMDLYSAAYKYSLWDLVRKCGDFLVDELAVQNVCEVASVAYSHGDEKLLYAAKDFVMLNAAQIMADDSWAKLLSEKPLLAAKLANPNLGNHNKENMNFAAFTSDVSD